MIAPHRAPGYSAALAGVEDWSHANFLATLKQEKLSPADIVAQRISESLSAIESRFDISILFACESGSRGWGFESADSDYDVRFVFWHRLDWYLSVAKRRDVIEVPLQDSLDINGWELRKALRLARKANPALLEWVHSPILYRTAEPWFGRFRVLVQSAFSPRACFASYRSMAHNNFREYLRGETVWTKKYLYVLRPVLGCLWIERGFGPVPMRLNDLVARTIEEPDLLKAIEALVARKKAGAELEEGPRIPEISGFLERELARLNAVEMPPENAPDDAAMNEFLREILLENGRR